MLVRILSLTFIKHEGIISLVCFPHHCPGEKLVDKGLNWRLLKNFWYSKGHFCWIIFRPVTTPLKDWYTMGFINTCHSGMQKSFHVTGIGFDTKQHDIQSLFWLHQPLISSPWQKRDSSCILQCTLILYWPQKTHIKVIFSTLRTMFPNSNVLFIL